MAEPISSISTTSEQNERLLGFADAVFAIAMTFLALDLGDIPENLGESGGPSAADYLADSVGAYGVYFATFLVVAFLWWRHHIIFRYIKKSSPLLVWLNIGMLALVAALPYPAQILGETRGSSLALLMLLAPLVLIGTLLWLQWVVALKQKLVIPNLPTGTRRYVHAQLLTSPVVMLVAAGLALAGWREDSSLAYRLAIGAWVMLVVVAAIARRIWPVPEQATEVMPADVAGDWVSSEEVDGEQNKRVRSILTRVRNGSDTDRLKVLTDGVVAIAVTILALQLRPPVETGVITNQDLLDNLASTPWAIYLTTFLLISLFWLAHVRIFKRVQGANTILVWLNLLFLMFVSFLPTPSVLQAKVSDSETTTFYLASMFLTSATLTAMSVYSLRGKTLPVIKADDFEATYGMVRSIIISTTFLTVAVLVWLTGSSLWAFAIYVVLILTGRVSQAVAKKIDLRDQNKQSVDEPAR